MLTSDQAIANIAHPAFSRRRRSGWHRCEDLTIVKMPRGVVARFLATIDPAGEPLMKTTVVVPGARPALVGRSIMNSTAAHGNVLLTLAGN